MKITYIIGSLLVVALAGFFFLKGGDEVVIETVGGTAVIEATEDERLVKENPSNVVAAEAVVVTPSVEPVDVSPEELTNKQGELRNYTNAENLANITGTNILFFKASWCPTCTALYDSLVAEQSRIPEGVTIWVVDYDTNKDMRIKYGVTTQHTLVQIDAELNKIHLWNGGFSLAEVMSNVK